MTALYIQAFAPTTDYVHAVSYVRVDDPLRLLMRARLMNQLQQTHQLHLAEDLLDACYWGPDNLNMAAQLSEDRLRVRNGQFWLECTDATGNTLTSDLCSITELAEHLANPDPDTCLFFAREGETDQMHAMVCADEHDPDTEPA
jgi:hypothetical protein